MEEDGNHGSVEEAAVDGSDYKGHKLYLQDGHHLEGYEHQRADMHA